MSLSFAYLPRRIRGQFYFKPIVFSNWKRLCKSFRNLGAILSRKHFCVSLLCSSQRRLLLTLLVTDLWAYLTQFWHYLPGSCTLRNPTRLLPFHSPFQTPIANPGYHLQFWFMNCKSGIPMTFTSGVDYFARAAHRT